MSWVTIAEKPALKMISIQKKFLPQTINYTGEQLSSLWIYQQTGLQGDAMVSFIGKADVREHMVDLEDIRNEAFIYSEQMLHFLVEHFNGDLEKAVLRQRMLIVIIKECLDRVLGSKFKVQGSMPPTNLEPRTSNLERQGDDLYVDERKLSVSIATLSPVSSLIHVGLNISNQNTPVKTFGLNEIMEVDAISEFSETVMCRYDQEMKSIHHARCKVKGVS